jgi:translation initiation factor IF-2
MSETTQATNVPNNQGAQASEPKDAETPKGLSAEEVQKLVEAARKQEKDKLFERLSKQESEAKAAKEAAAAKDAELLKAQESLKVYEAAKAKEAEKQKAEEESKMSDADKLARRLEEMEARLAAQASAALEKSQALETELNRMRVAAFRAEAIAQSGIRLTQFVSGNTPEEIQASIEALKAKEAEISAAATAKAEEELRKKLNLPSPVSPSTGPPAAPKLSRDRSELSALKTQEDYLRYEAEMLAKLTQGG